MIVLREKAMRVSPALLLVLLSLHTGCGDRKPDNSQPAQPSTRLPEKAPASPKESTPNNTASWPTYHGDNSLSGFADVTLPDQLIRRWRVDLGAEVTTTPVAGNGRILAADDKGQIHVIDFSGKKLLSRAFTETLMEGRPPGEATFDSPLALFETTLIACSAGGTVFALNPADLNITWQTNTHMPLLGSPNLAVTATSPVQRRLLLIDQSQGSLHAIDFDTGKELWKSEGIARCDSSPAVNAEVAAFGSCAAAIHFFSTNDGAKIREIDMGADCEIAGGIAIVDGSVYSGSRCGKFVQINAQTGAIDWTNSDCEGEALETPAVSDTLVAYTANDGYVYALNRGDGKLKWRVKLGYTPSSPVLTRNKLFASVDGKLFMLSLDDGHTIWSYEVSDDITSPAIVGDLVVVGCDDGSVIAFAPKGN